MEKSSGICDWSKLHDYILGEIFDKLVIADYIRFSAACKSWRIVFLENPYKMPFLPGLVILTKGTNQKCNIYSFLDQRVYDSPFWLPHQLSYYGSSFGWLITLHWSYNRMYDVKLINPFLSNNETIHLPPLSTDLLLGDYTRLRKFVLSTNPAVTSNNSEIMGIFGWRVLVYFKPGRKVWIPIKWKKARGDGIRSLIFFKKTKQFYAVDGSGAVVVVEAGTKPKLKQVARSNPNYGWLDTYIVESASGELLQIHKENLEGKKYEFYVDKLDKVRRKWIPMLSLGEHILFLSAYYSSCFSTTEFPVCKRNCIYFVDYGGFDETPVLTVFNFVDRTTEACYMFE